MIRQQMIEKEEELVCSMNHKLPIYMVVCDKSIDKNKRLLCNECMDNLESNLNNVMSFKKVALLIEDNQKKKVEQVEYNIMKNIKQIDEIQKTLHQLKSYIIQQLDQLIGNTDEWIKCLQQIGQQNVNYSFFKELDNLINKVQIQQQYDDKPLITQINQINQSWNQKIINKLNQFKSFELTNKCEQLLINLQTINQQQHLIQQINIIQQQQQIDNLQLKQYDLEFKLIDDSNKQIVSSYSIVFNNTGSIMISNDGYDIIIWDFNQGRLKLQNRFSVHQDSVQCLVFSKNLNSFISGSDDKSIICWKQINNNEWKWSQSYQQHNDWVSCLILNKQEDQLISGGRDNSIKIWNVDFIKNELTYLYSLDNTAAVYSLSLNQSETMLASCAKNRYLIWKKGVNEKWELKCKQEVTQGYKIYFMDDQQFLWVTNDKNIDQILIFELEDGLFKQNQDKTIQLNTNQLCEDDWRLFPIIYNKDKNMLLVRHKHHIYIISKINEGNFKIIGSLNCDIKEIFGTITDNAQYLVFWDGKQQKYSSYELLQK
ncbi:unnamed protein product [Paramecium primaurelia]|uniref:WD40-repeat-containing domain n=1 Tax=Paramecium primaurelia TaxID=5886 RepID=A0A8S1QEE6_PARPR|nr:unnamed protein product [Paramecium primaurelia]